MTDPILTAEQIADLVERTRMASLALKPGGSLARVAAHYSRFASVSLGSACRTLGANRSLVYVAWRRLYPNTPALLSRR